VSVLTIAINEIDVGCIGEHYCFMLNFGNMGSCNTPNMPPKYGLARAIVNIHITELVLENGCIHKLSDRFST